MLFHFWRENSNQFEKRLKMNFWIKMVFCISVPIFWIIMLSLSVDPSLQDNCSFFSKCDENARFWQLKNLNVQKLLRILFTISNGCKKSIAINMLIPFYYYLQGNPIPTVCIFIDYPILLFWWRNVFVCICASNLEDINFLHRIQKGLVIFLNLRNLSFISLLLNIFSAWRCPTIFSIVSSAKYAQHSPLSKVRSTKYAQLSAFSTLHSA